MYKNKELKIDVVLLSIIDNELSVLLLERPYEPFINKWALPGGFIPENMSADEAAMFQLNKKTGLQNVYLEQLSLFSDPKRDPKSIASMAYLSLVDHNAMKTIKTDDALNIKWVKISELEDLAFDHNKIIEKAKERMINQIRYTKVGFELAGTIFTMKELMSVFKAVTGKSLDQSNVRKKMNKLNLLIEVKNNKSDSKTVGRPAPLFQLNETVYNSLDVSESFFN